MFLQRVHQELPQSVHREQREPDRLEYPQILGNLRANSIISAAPLDTAC